MAGEKRTESENEESKKCVFCSIRDGKAEGKILYEDELCFVLLDKYPLTKGHLMVISKTHYRAVIEAPDEVASHVFLKAKEYAKKVVDKLGADGVNVGANTGRAAGQIIFHFHVHVVPRYSGSGTASSGFWNRRGEELKVSEAEELYSALHEG